MPREVKEVVDGNGLYYSRAVRADSFVYVAGVAVDEKGQLAAAAKVEPPYHLSPSANVRTQTNFVFGKHKTLLSQFGSSVNDIVQVEQHIPWKVHADGYLEISRGPEFMTKGRPGSALLETGDLLPSEAVINPTAIAVIPSDKIKKEIVNPGALLPGKEAKRGDSYSQEPPYNEMVRAGPYFFTVGDVSCDFKTGIHPDARIEDWIWWGNQARSETSFLLKVVESRMKAINSSMDNMIHASVFITDLADLHEIDLVWKKFFPRDPPARYVTPVRGLGVPRKEGARGQPDSAVCIETMFRGVIPGQGVKKEVVKTDVEPIGYQSTAVKAGSALWISGQLAGDKSGRLSAPDARSQADYIFHNIASICKAAGTNINNLCRVAVGVTSKDAGYAVFGALKAAVPANPPTVVMTTVPEPLHIPGCSVLIGATAYVPQ